MDAYDREVVLDFGIILFGPIAQLGVAPALQAGGRRFDPDWVHHSNQ